MATYSVEAVEIFGQGVLQAEGVGIDKGGNVYGGGRNGIIYKVSPDGKVTELVTLPSGSIPNGITMDRNGDLVYCDLGKQAVIRVTQRGQVSLIADRVGEVKLTLPNFALYDAAGNLHVSNTSTRDINAVLSELSHPEPNRAAIGGLPACSGRANRAASPEILVLKGPQRAARRLLYDFSKKPPLEKGEQQWRLYIAILRTFFRGNSLVKSAVYRY